MRSRFIPPLKALSFFCFSLSFSACTSFYNPSVGDPSQSPSTQAEEEATLPSRQITAFQLGALESLETSSTSPIGISLPVSGAEDLEGSPCSNLAVLAIPSDPSLFDSGSFTLMGTYPNCTLQIRPAPGQCGSAEVSLRITVSGEQSDDIVLNYTASGKPYTLGIENAPDGIGVPIDTDILTESGDGTAITAYAVVRNQCGQFVRNQSVLWDLSPTVTTQATLSSVLGSSTTLLVNTTFNGPRPNLDIPLTANHADFDSETAQITYKYANSNLQLWLDAQSEDTLFQDLAETLPATANSDAIRLWKDRSGNDRHAAQWTDARKPALDLSGPLPTVGFTKDCLQIGTNGEDFNILDSDAFTIAFVVARKNNTNAPSMGDGATYPNGRFMPLLSMQDFTISPAEGLLRIVANNAYAAVTQYRTNRETPGNYWFSSNSITNNGNQCFGNTGSGGTCPAGSASEASQVFVSRGDITRIHQQIHRSGTLSTAGLGVTVTAAGITAMRNSAPTSFPTFLGCDYDQSAGTEYDGPFTSGANVTGHFPFTGSLSEIVIYNTYLSDADTVTLVNQLVSKWGL